MADIHENQKKITILLSSQYIKLNFNLFIAEVALYALDVYYNNTYANTNNRWDTKNGNSFTNSDLNCPSCPYYDPYQQTYRNNKQESSLLYNIAKIPQWITLAYEM